MLAIEDQKIPPQEGVELGERGVGIANKATKHSLSCQQFALDPVLDHWVGD
jgi:hypothetical protein